MAVKEPFINNLFDTAQIYRYKSPNDKTVMYGVLHRGYIYYRINDIKKWGWDGRENFKQSLWDWKEMK